MSVIREYFCREIIPSLILNYPFFFRIIALVRLNPLPVEFALLVFCMVSTYKFVTPYPQSDNLGQMSINILRPSYPAIFQNK